LVLWLLLPSVGIGLYWYHLPLVLGFVGIDFSCWQEVLISPFKFVGWCVLDIYPRWNSQMVSISISSSRGCNGHEFAVGVVECKFTFHHAPTHGVKFKLNAKQTWGACSSCRCYLFVF
jgi:hypothetical protein